MTLTTALGVVLIVAGTALYVYATHKLRQTLPDPQQESRQRHPSAWTLPDDQQPVQAADASTRWYDIDTFDQQFLRNNGIAQPELYDGEVGGW